MILISGEAAPLSPRSVIVSQEARGVSFLCCIDRVSIAEPAEGAASAEKERPATFDNFIEPQSAETIITHKFNWYTVHTHAYSLKCIRGLGCV